MLTGHRKTGPLRVPISRPTPPGPEQLPQYWTPFRVGAYPAPAWFTQRLHAIDPDLSINWNPVSERWQVWVRKPSLSITQGWLLLFIVKDAHGGYLPLDERIFARIYEISARKWENAREYFRAIEREFHRDRELRDERSTQESVDRAMPSFEHSQIRVGYGKSNGSKFADYHS